MPTYDYQCKSCDHPYTAMHKISESAPACPECGGADIRKLVAAPAVHGKGGGASHAEPACAAPAFQGGCGSGMCGHRH
jgi:putative FmdB family regulatory protein